MTNTVNMVPEQVGSDASALHPNYLEALTLVERLHRRLLDVIKDEFERNGNDEINSVQALLLYNIGDSVLSAGELRTRGHYLGSNVSYNLKKLVDAGFIDHKRSNNDRRSVRVCLTDKGQAIAKQIGDLYERHIQSLGVVGGFTADDLGKMNEGLSKLERFWTDQIRYRL